MVAPEVNSPAPFHERGTEVPHANGQPEAGLGTPPANLERRLGAGPGDHLPTPAVLSQLTRPEGCIDKSKVGPFVLIGCENKGK